MTAADLAARLSRLADIHSNRCGDEEVEHELRCALTGVAVYKRDGAALPSDRLRLREAIEARLAADPVLLARVERAARPLTLTPASRRPRVCQVHGARADGRPWPCDCPPQHDDHVEERQREIALTVDRYVSDTSYDVDEVSVDGVIAYLEEDGLHVPRLEAARLLLQCCARTAEVRQDIDGYEATNAARLAWQTLYGHGYVERGEPIPSREWRARWWYREQRLSLEGRCFVHEGGTGPKCAACQADALGPDLAASLGSVAGRKAVA